MGWGGIITSLALTHSSCYATVRCLGLAPICHATLLDVFLHFHTYVMLRYWTLSRTSTDTACNAAVRSLGLPCICHATLLNVFLHFHTYVMLRYWTLSRTSTDTACYAAVHSLGLPCICHTTLLYVLLDFHTYVMLRYCTKGSWKNLKRCCEQKTAEKLWKQISWGLRIKPRNEGVV